MFDSFHSPPPPLPSLSSLAPAGTLISSDEEATDMIPDNDRAALRIKKASRPARVQKSSKYPSGSGYILHAWTTRRLVGVWAVCMAALAVGNIVFSPAVVPQWQHSPSLRVACQVSSDEEEDHQSLTSPTHTTNGKISLTRSPIHTQDTPQINRTRGEWGDMGQTLSFNVPHVHTWNMSIQCTFSNMYLIV